MAVALGASKPAETTKKKGGKKSTASDKGAEDNAK